VPHVSFDAVEFVGGPFDGLLRFGRGSVKDLKRQLAAPVNQNVVQMLDGYRTTTKAPATSIAIYELRTFSRHARYAFVGSVPPSRFPLADWVG